MDAKTLNGYLKKHYNVEIGDLDNNANYKVEFLIKVTNSETNNLVAQFPIIETFKVEDKDM